MFKTINDLHNHRVFRYKYISESLCKALQNEHNLTPFVIFAIAFVWHCHTHLNVDFNIDKIYMKINKISNMSMLNTFFLNYKYIFKSIKPVDMKKAIKLFEEDNGDFNTPHGYIASTYNITQITNGFTKSINFVLNDSDTELLSRKLSCVQ